MLYCFVLLRVLCGCRTASTLIRSNSGSSSGSKCTVTFVSMGCSSRACVALMQILQFGYLEMMYMINSGSVLFQEEVGRTSSALSCGNLQEGQRRGSASCGGRATAITWDSAPNLNLLFPPELDFTFAVRGMATTFAEAVAPAGVRAADKGAAVAAGATDSAAKNWPHPGKPGEEGNSAEPAAKPSGAPVPAYVNLGSGTMSSDVDAVVFWIKAVLPALPAVCTLGVATHLLGDAFSEGEPQIERSDSSAVDVRYSVRLISPLSGKVVITSVSSVLYSFFFLSSLLSSVLLLQLKSGLRTSQKRHAFKALRNV